MCLEDSDIYKSHGLRLRVRTCRNSVRLNTKLPVLVPIDLPCHQLSIRDNSSSYRRVTTNSFSDYTKVNIAALIDATVTQTVRYEDGI